TIGHHRAPPKQGHEQGQRTGTRIPVYASRVNDNTRAPMARNIRSKLESRSNRLALKRVRKPVYERIGTGCWLGYRRTKTNGTWVVRCLRDGSEWTKAFGDADDFEASNQKTVLTYFEAQQLARTLAGAGKDGTATVGSRPVTAAEAVDAY